MPVDLTKEKLVHMNDNYQVVFIPEQDRKTVPDHNGVDIINNFEVRNRVYDTVEFSTDSLPMALSMAENWNTILKDKLYMRMAKDYYEPTIQIVDTEEDPSGFLN